MNQEQMENYVLRIYDVSDKNREMLEKVKEALEMTANLLDRYEQRIENLEEWRRSIEED